MKPLRLKKLAWILFFLAVLSVVTCLVTYALRQNISLFYTPSQLALSNNQLPKQSIRLGGMVEKGSVKRQSDGLSVQFKITDFKESVVVNYRGILPDLFREGQGIVAHGKMMDKGHFMADEVLAKHDANYMPPEVKSALDATAKTDTPYIDNRNAQAEKSS
jgi:cytochrome c-type biogenesis protein CcmE